MTWSQLMLDPLHVLWEQLFYWLPKMFGGVLIVLVGWLIAMAMRFITVRFLQRCGCDRLAEQAKVSDLFRRGAVRSTVAELLGQVGYWLVLVASIIAALQYAGVTAAGEWLERFGYFVPRVMLSLVIVFCGTLLAAFLGTTTRVAGLNAGWPHARLLERVVATAVVLLAVIMALEQLQVLTQTIQVALYILLASCGLACALAVGLGGQEFVRRWLAELWDQWKQSPRP